MESVASLAANSVPPESGEQQELRRSSRPKPIKPDPPHTNFQSGNSGKRKRGSGKGKDDSSTGIVGFRLPNGVPPNRIEIIDLTVEVGL